MQTKIKKNKIRKKVWFLTKEARTYNGVKTVSSAKIYAKKIN
jgi:hypothetical protein